MKKVRLDSLIQNEACLKFCQTEGTIKTYLVKGKGGSRNTVSFKDGISLLIQCLSCCF